MSLMEIKQIRKMYTKKRGLREVNMTVEPGRIIGLLGPNSAGKTTLMKVVAGLLTPDAGEICYPNGAKRGVEAREMISFLPDSMTFPTWMKVRDAFDFYQAMYPDYSPEKAAYMMQILDLPADEPIRRLSKGMQERVSLGVTFSRNTSLYLLDEPLGGIDPLGKSKILESILSMELDDASILLSTHLVKEVETIFDSVFFISEGQVVYSGECEEIREQQGKTVEQMYVEVFSNVKPM